jgi:hypothetical protein
MTLLAPPHRNVAHDAMPLLPFRYHRIYRRLSVNAFNKR